MEMDFGGGLAMNLAFRLGQLAKYLEGFLFDAFAQSRRAEYRFDIAQLAMRLIAGDFHFKPRAGDSAARGARALQLVEAERKLFQFLQQAMRVETRVEQRPQKHVTTNSRRTIQICLSHKSLGRISPALPVRTKSANESSGVGSGLMTAIIAPDARASSASPAAG